MKLDAYLTPYEKVTQMEWRLKNKTTNGKTTERENLLRHWSGQRSFGCDPPKHRQQKQN
jgi:hypothetical protein